MFKKIFSIVFLCISFNRALICADQPIYNDPSYSTRFSVIKIIPFNQDLINLNPEDISEYKRKLKDEFFKIIDIDSPWFDKNIIEQFFFVQFYTAITVL